MKREKQIKDTTKLIRGIARKTDDPNVLGELISKLTKVAPVERSEIDNAVLRAAVRNPNSSAAALEDAEISEMSHFARDKYTLGLIRTNLKGREGTHAQDLLEDIAK